MELINPDGSKMEPKKEDEKIVPANNGAGIEGESKVEEKPKDKVEEAEPPLKLDFHRVGWMRVEVNLEALSHSQATVDQFGGFMERVKAQGFKIISNIAGQRESVRQALMKDQNKNGHRSFIEKLIRRK